MTIDYKQISLLIAILLMYLKSDGQSSDKELPPPNILWISWEDVSQTFGCYGDDYAVTPNIDELAEDGIVYQNAYANNPICAPARSTLITGQYANSYGGQNMRVRSVPGRKVRLFPQLLRESGYYVTNDGKYNYQMAFDRDIPFNRESGGGYVWDNGNFRAPWNGRNGEQPFFSIINFTRTHEGPSRAIHSAWEEQVEDILGEKAHDPSGASVPPYLPDNNTTRECIALHHDNITYTDSLSGIVLDRLEEEGLAENTIVFFWGDHGWGMPRGKRWLYESGLKVPLVIRVPDKYEHLLREGQKPGTKTDELVSFVDFAPTMLSLAGASIPDYMQGQAFLGKQRKPPRDHVYVYRDRADEKYDMMRGVVTRDFLYLRNYRPYLPYAQTIRTMEQHPVMQDLREMHKENRLNDAQSKFFQYPRPVEELYDLNNDPHNLNNLAKNGNHEDELKKLRAKHLEWMRSINDVGLIPEPIFDRMKWPEGKWQRTGKPYFESEYQNYIDGGKIEVTIHCPTPGASIAWKYEGSNSWHLYNDQPIVIGPNQVLQAKASRLGFYTSKVANYQLGDPLTKTKNPATNYVPWQKKVSKELISKILELKSLDYQKANNLEEYYQYLDAKEATVRYWATMGIRNHSNTEKEITRATQKFNALTHDESPAVRIEAAHGLCKWGHYDVGMRILRNALDHRQEAVRLYAMNVLDKMGEKPRMILPFPKIPLYTGGEYSHRIMCRIYKRLGIEPEDLDYATPDQVQNIRNTYNTIILDNLWDYNFK